MTEKRYKMVNTNLVDDDGLVYYLIKKDGRDVCQVFGKHTAKAIVTELNSLHEENEQLKAQLYCNHNDGVCSICKHCYLEEQSYYYISKCEKGHEQCSKEAVKYCEDFEIKGDIE